MKKTPRFYALLLTTLYLFSVFIIQAPLSAEAYTSCDGVETNDVIYIQYRGTIQSTGTQFDAKDDQRFTVNPERVIVGFYEGLLGMKVGDQKTIIVPPSKGYTEESRAPTVPETGETLYGKTLVFEVHLNRVSEDSISECGGTASNSKFADFLWKFLGWVAGLVVVGFIGITGYFSLQKQTTPSCVHCKEQGRDRLSEGKCGKCGNHYCRPSFSRGCPNCKSNSFVPNK